MNTAANSFDIYRSVADGTGWWTTPQPVTELNTALKEGLGSMTADGLTLIFDRQISAGVPKNDMFVSTRPDKSSPWGTPVAIAEINTAYNTSRGQISPEGLQMVFSSDRPGGLGDRDIWQTSRASIWLPWNAPTLSTALSSANFDSPDHWASNGNIWISKVASPDTDIYEGLNPVPEPVTVTLMGAGALSLVCGVRSRRRAAR
jgi:hypothetical protein